MSFLLISRYSKFRKRLTLFKRLNGKPYKNSFFAHFLNLLNVQVKILINNVRFHITVKPR